MSSADAYVTCRDGKIRYFTADDGEVFHYKGGISTFWPLIICNLCLLRQKLGRVVGIGKGLINE
jgi:hypothetical protein